LIYGGLFGEIEVLLFDAALCGLPAQQLLIHLLLLVFLVLHRLLPARVDHDDVFAAELALLVDGRPFLIQLNHAFRVVEGVRVFNDLLGVSFGVVCMLVSVAAGRGGVVFVGGVQEAVL
jgi:hypothetical protein